MDHECIRLVHIARRSSTRTRPISLRVPLTFLTFLLSERRHPLEVRAALGDPLDDILQRGDP